MSGIKNIYKLPIGLLIIFSVILEFIILNIIGRFQLSIIFEIFLRKSRSEKSIYFSEIGSFGSNLFYAFLPIISLIIFVFMVYIIDYILSLSRYKKL